MHIKKPQAIPFKELVEGDTFIDLDENTLCIRTEDRYMVPKEGAKSLLFNSFDTQRARYTTHSNDKRVLLVEVLGTAKPVVREDQVEPATE